jgi:hypothetical protein
MMIVTTVSDYLQESRAWVILCTHIFPVYLRPTFLVVMMVITVLDFRNPKLGVLFETAFLLCV